MRWSFFFAESDRNFRRGRERGGGLQGVHPGRQPVQRQRRQTVEAQICLPVSWAWVFIGLRERMLHHVDIVEKIFKVQCKDV